MALGLLDAVQAAPLRERAELSFFASGMPAPQGSKRAFRNSHTGRIQQVESSKKLPGWRSDVRDAVENAMAGREPFVAGALEVCRPRTCLLVAASSPRRLLPWPPVPTSTSWPARSWTC
jgi:hypothetical protein